MHGVVAEAADRLAAGAREPADDGPGIPAELLPTVFDRFAKSSDSRGSGLGLAIARAIVESHGGRIAAESPADGGTTIRIVLPGPSPTGG